ncbi:zinc finger and BTB domain-containing protein 12 [Amia ocellicauda]|uniref:zinc finger and BTB domain-containing protein 12 n=1 Tax=Amia ocellicauda TaxID=2972642 RepID=UPI003463E8B2
MEVLRFRLPGHGDATLRNMNTLRTRQRFCDITIVANDNQKFRGHKVVLAACSPFLRDQFLLNPSSELQVSLLHSSSIVCELLLSCYTGLLQFSVGQVVDYLTAASYLQMEFVVEKCRGALSQVIQPRITSLHPFSLSPSSAGQRGSCRAAVSRAPPGGVCVSVQAPSRTQRPSSLSQADRPTDAIHSLPVVKVKVEEASEDFLEEECEEDYEDFPEVCIVEEEEEEENDDELDQGREGREAKERAGEGDGGMLVVVGQEGYREKGREEVRIKEEQVEEREGEGDDVKEEEGEGGRGWRASWPLRDGERERGRGRGRTRGRGRGRGRAGAGVVHSATGKMGPLGMQEASWAVPSLGQGAGLVHVGSSRGMGGAESSGISSSNLKDADGDKEDTDLDAPLPSSRPEFPSSLAPAHTHPRYQLSYLNEAARAEVAVEVEEEEEEVEDEDEEEGVEVVGEGEGVVGEMENEEAFVRAAGRYCLAGSSDGYFRHRHGERGGARRAGEEEEDEEEESVAIVGSTSCPSGIAGAAPVLAGAVTEGGAVLSVQSCHPDAGWVSVLGSLSCERCGVLFPSPESLSAHSRAAHFLFVCPRCGKQFNHSSNLNRHMNVHRGVKSHRCPLCLKTFTQKSTLSDHLNLHSGERPYRCSYCHARFAHKPAIRRHLKEQHGKTTAQNRERGGD